MVNRGGFRFSEWRRSRQQSVRRLGGRGRLRGIRRGFSRTSLSARVALLSPGYHARANEDTLTITDDEE